MEITLTSIMLKKLHKILINTIDNFETQTNTNDIYALSFQAEIMQLGFIMSKELFKIVAKLEKESIAFLSSNIVKILKDIVGDDIIYKPFYPNFPQQVIDSSYVELFLNSMFHYWSAGEYIPDYEVLPREYHFENKKFKELGLGTLHDSSILFNRLVTSKDSLSEYDKQVLIFFLNEFPNLVVSEASYKETMCIIAGEKLKHGQDISGFIRTATDILRVITFLSDGDISLASNTKYKSFPNKQRKLFTNLIRKVASIDDLMRHKNKWKRVFHSLHIGSYGKDLFDLAKKLRDNKAKVVTFAGKIEKALKDKDIKSAIDFLVKRPGDFARKLDELLRHGKDETEIIEKFESIIDKVSTRVLLQLLGHFQIRNKDRESMIVFPKGSVQKAQYIEKNIPALKADTWKSIMSILKASLIKRFATHKQLGKTWINPSLKYILLPSQQRSASDGMFSLGRGSKLELSDKNIFRFFVYWKDGIGETIDLDLSASFFDENFNHLESCSYYHLKNNSTNESDSYYAVHSGDFISAPNGACEFIDIDIDKTLKYMDNARYIMTNVWSYSGQAFSECEKCYVGWMGLDHPAKNRIYDPSLVEQKLNISSSAKNHIGVLIDLVDKKLIWCDLASGSQLANRRYDNSSNNKASLQHILKAITNHDNKVNLYDLLMLHVQARSGELVDKKDADSIFDMDLAFDVNTINSELIVDIAIKDDTIE